MTARPVAHAQFHLAVLETASSSETTSDLSVRAGSVAPPGGFTFVSCRFQYPTVSCKSVNCSASHCVRSDCCRNSSRTWKVSPPPNAIGPSPSDLSSGMSLRVRHAEYVPSISVAQNRPLTAFLDSVGSAPGRRAAPTATSTFSLVSPRRNSAASSLWTAITARAARACAAPSSKSRPKRASAVLRMGLGSRKGSAEGVVAYSLPPESQPAATMASVRLPCSNSMSTNPVRGSGPGLTLWRKALTTSWCVWFAKKCRSRRITLAPAADAAYASSAPMSIGHRTLRVTGLPSRRILACSSPLNMSLSSSALAFRSLSLASATCSLVHGGLPACFRFWSMCPSRVTACWYSRSTLPRDGVAWTTTSPRTPKACLALITRVTSSRKTTES